MRKLVGRCFSLGGVEDSEGSGVLSWKGDGGRQEEARQKRTFVSTRLGLPIRLQLRTRCSSGNSTFDSDSALSNYRSFCSLLYSGHSRAERTTFILFTLSTSSPHKGPPPPRDMSDYIEDRNIHDPIPDAAFGATGTIRTSSTTCLPQAKEAPKNLSGLVFSLERQYDPGPARKETGGMNKRP